MRGTGAMMRVLAVAVLALSGAGLAGAAPARQAGGKQGSEPAILVLSGVIGPGAHRDFRRVVARTKPDLVVLDGPGGVLGEAILIADEIRARRINTAVSANRSCASACAVVFLSGWTKYLGQGAAVGLHMARYADGRRSPMGTSIMAGYLRQLGVPKRILTRMARTAPDDISWLSRADHKALKIQSY